MVLISGAWAMSNLNKPGSSSKSYSKELKVLDVKNNKLPSYQHRIDIRLESESQAKDFMGSYKVSVEVPGLDVVIKEAKAPEIIRKASKSVDVRIFLPVMQEYNNYIITYKDYSFELKNVGKSRSEAITSRECFALNANADSCLRDYFHKKVIREKSPVGALDEINTLVKEDKGNLNKCHSWAHAAGEAAGWVYKDWAKAIQFAKNSCNFGYYHGVQEGLAAVVSTPEMGEKLNNICNVFILDMMIVDCAHGLGHLAYWRTGGDYFESMKLCDGLRESKGVESDNMVSCAAGVTMNWAIDYQSEATASGKHIFTKPAVSEPFSVCREIEGKNGVYLRAGCYNYIHFTEVENKEVLSKIIEKCRRLTESVSEVWCTLGYARDYGHFPEVSVEEVLNECMKSSNKDAIWTCGQGIVYVKIITTNKAGSAERVCRYFKAKNFDSSNYEKNCKLIKEMEERRLKSEGAILQVTTNRQ